MTLTVTDSRSATGQAAKGVTVSNEPTPQVEVHIGDLDGAAEAAPRNRRHPLLALPAACIARMANRKDHRT